MPDEITALSESTEFVDFKVIDGIFYNLEDRKRLSPAAAIGARNIIRIWRMPPASAATLIGVSLGTWYRIRRNHWSGSFTQDQMTRISLLIGIYRGLQIRLGEDLGNRWVNLTNNGPLFRGWIPCELMVAKGILGMWQVRRYVDAIG